MNKQLSYNSNPNNNRMKAVEKKLAISAAVRLYDNQNNIEGINIPFTAGELQDHAEKNPGRWKLSHEYPNRQVRRSTISPKNMKRFNNSQFGLILQNAKINEEMTDLKKSKEIINRIQDEINMLRDNKVKHNSAV